MWPLAPQRSSPRTSGPPPLCPHPPCSQRRRSWTVGGAAPPRIVLTRCVSVARSQWFSSACLVECQHLPPADKRRVTRVLSALARRPRLSRRARGRQRSEAPRPHGLHLGLVCTRGGRPRHLGDFVTGRPPSPSSLRPCRCLCLSCRKGTGRRETAEAASPPSGPPLSFPATRCFSL